MQTIYDVIGYGFKNNKTSTVKKQLIALQFAASFGVIT